MSNTRFIFFQSTYRILAIMCQKRIECETSRNRNFLASVVVDLYADLCKCQGHQVICQGRLAHVVPQKCQFVNSALIMT